MLESALQNEISRFCDLDFVGICLNCDEQEYITKGLLILEKKMPKNGQIKLQITQSKNGQALHGRLTILGHNNIFESGLEGANIYQLYKKLVKEINEQMRFIF